VPPAIRALFDEERISTGGELIALNRARLALIGA